MRCSGAVSLKATKIIAWGEMSEANGTPGELALDDPTLKGSNQSLFVLFLGQEAKILA